MNPKVKHESMLRCLRTLIIILHFFGGQIIIILLSNNYPHGVNQLHVEVSF